MKYTVTVRARLREVPAAAKKYHDEVTRATKDAAKQAGDLTHVVYLDPQDPKAFLGVDTWSSIEGIQKFAGSPQIREFFATKAAPFQPQNHWASDTATYKIHATVSGNSGTLYFECHYIDVDTQKEIKSKLRSAMYERESKKIVDDLKRKAVIEYSRGAAR